MIGWSDSEGFVGTMQSPLEGPQPGERCETCHRRVPKKRTSTAPETKRIVATLPPERAEALVEALDWLQEYTGADKTSYPKGALLELLLGLGAAHREEIKDYFA